MADFKLLRLDAPDLSRYLPVFLAKDNSFKECLTVLSKEHTKLWQTGIDLWQQFYAKRATWGLRDWEHFLGLTTDESLSYTVRRSAIIAKLHGEQTVTVEFLENLVDSFTSDKSVRVVDHPDQYNVDIYFLNGSVLSFEEMDKAIRTFMPAHIGWVYRYNTSVNGALYAAAALRPARMILALGKAAKDTMSTTASVLRYDTAVFAATDNDDTAVAPTDLGAKTNPVWDATLAEITPCPYAEAGATDGLFTVQDDGTITTV